MGQHQCPLCGAWLDAGEKCDCENEKGPERREAGQGQTKNHIAIVIQERRKRNGK